MPTPKVSGPGTSGSGVRCPTVRLAPSETIARAVGRMLVCVATVWVTLGVAGLARASDDRPRQRDAAGLAEQLAPPPPVSRSDRVDPPPTSRRSKRRLRRDRRRGASPSASPPGDAASPAVSPPSRDASATGGATVWFDRWSRAFLPLAEAGEGVTVPPHPAPVSLGAVTAHFAPPPGAVANPDATRGRGRPAPPRLLAKSGVPPFWFKRQYDTHTTTAGVFPPLLFVHRTPEADHPERFLHLNPLAYGWYSKEARRRRWFSPALFFGSFSERKTVWGAVPLLMGYRRVGEQFNFGQFPLVWWWGTKFVKNILVIPFHYQQEAPDGKRSISALLFWYGHKNLHDAEQGNDRRHFVAAPVFWRFSRGLRRLDISPLYVGGANKLTGLRHRAVAPLFLWQSLEFGNRKELWTLPFIRRSDKARRMRAWAVAPALTFSHRGPDRTVMSATPLFWRAENRLKGSKLTLAGLYGHYDDPRQASRFVAPLWFRFTDKQARAHTDLILPLGFSRSAPGRRAVWTLLGGGGQTKHGWAAFALPVAGAAVARRDGLKVQGALGVLWHVDAPARGDKPRRNTFVVGPLAYAQRRGGKGDGQFRFGVPALLSFGAFGGEKRYQMLTPLLIHVREKTADRDRRTLVGGPFFHHRLTDKDGKQIDGGLPPLFFYGTGAKRRYAVVPWLLTADHTHVASQRRLTVSPLYVRSASPTYKVQGFAGLAWDVQRPNERHSIALPLYYRRQIGDRTLTMTPIGGRYRRGDDLFSVFGLYARRRVGERDGAGILPVVWWDRRPAAGGGVARHLVIAPVLLRRRSPTDNLDMWTPLVWRRQILGEGARRNLAIVPAYFRQRQPGGVDVDAGLGFFYARDATRRTHTIIAGPVFHRLSRKGLHAGVFPLYWWQDTEQKRRLLALPTIVHIRDKAKGSHTTIAAPIWFDRKQPNGRRAWGAFPVVFGGRRLHNFTRFSVAPPGYFDIFRLAKNTRFTGHVPLLFRYQKCGFVAGDDPRCQYTLWGSAPFFLAGKDGLGRRTHASLLHYWDKRPKGFRLWTPLFGLTNYPGELLAWYGGPVGVRTTQTHRRVFAFPLYYRKKHRLQDSSLTLFAPPLFVSRHREDRRFFEAGLLVWQFRQLHKVSTAIVPPVFFHSYAYKQRRRYWVAPLFYRDNHMGADKTFTAIAPALYIQRRDGENLDFVQFPLVWHIERGANQGTFGAFVWWDIRVKDKILQTVPLAFTRWSTAEKDTRVIGPLLGWWTKGKGATEGDLHWRALFGIFGGGVEDGRKYRAIFGAKIDAGPAKTVPATPAKPSARRRLQRQARRAARRGQLTASPPSSRSPRG